MSTYIRDTKHPETGIWQSAIWLDDHFGSHHYGVQFLDGQIFDPEKVKLKTKDTPIENSKEMLESMREFDSGATRDTDEGKPDFEGYLSPIVVKEYGEYMLRHQTQADGTQRGSDNWQGLFGEDHYDICIKSAWRHFLDWWLHHRGYDARDNIKEALCAVIFNASAYLHKILLEENKNK